MRTFFTEKWKAKAFRDTIGKTDILVCFFAVREQACPTEA